MTFKKIINSEIKNIQKSRSIDGTWEVTCDIIDTLEDGTVVPGDSYIGHGLTMQEAEDLRVRCVTARNPEAYIRAIWQNQFEQAEDEYGRR